MKLALETLSSALSGTAAAFRCVTDYQPAGGAGDKVFPPTYESGKYAVEDRIIEGTRVPCVLLDSVQSQANRMELALLEARRDGRIEVPLVSVRFDHESLKKKFTVTSLDAPHRVADAILRDSLLDGVMFRQSVLGRALDNVEVRNATSLYRLNPTALVFGLWDSTGPRGGLGAKFQRAMVSEIVGVDAVPGVKTSSRIDPAQIMLSAGPLYARGSVNETSPNWTSDPDIAAKEKNQPRKLGKDGKPSEANHGNVTPGIDDGGFTIAHARQTTVLSLTAVRRLRFPLNGAADSDPSVDRAARTVLVALGLVAAVLAREEGADLRSRCQLVPVEQFAWELLDVPGEDPQKFELNGNEALAIYAQAVTKAKEAGLSWEDEIRLAPSDELVKLVAKSQELAAHQTEGEA
jgi:CRISPR-associated protein Csb1